MRSSSSRRHVLPDHTATEAYLKEMSSRLGFTYNIMRNNLYMENYLTNSVMLANLSDYVWGTNAKEGKFTPIAKDDSAACATALLLGKGGYNTDYDLTSETPISQREICAMVAERSGKPYRFVPMNDEEFYAYFHPIVNQERQHSELSVLFHIIPAKKPSALVTGRRFCYF